MFGVTTWTLDRQGADAIRRAAELGFSFVHLSIDELPSGRVEKSSALRQYVEVATDAGISLAGLAISPLETAGLRPIRKAKSVVALGVEWAETVGIPFVYVPSFHAAEIRDSEDLRLTATLLRYALRCAEGASVVVASENTLSGNGIRNLFDLVGDPRLRLLYDTQNPMIWGHDPTSLVRDVADLLGPVVHIKDGSCTVMGNARLGTGASQLIETVDALQASGFTGTFALENSYRSDAVHRSAFDQRALAAMLKE